MEAIIKGQIEGIKFGEPQVHEHVAVIPMLSTNGSGPDYLTMKEAMAGHFLTITEVTELKVINRADKPVLLLDGEELSGAKQNRVLNTTILLKELSETLIPVSCTEQGRWSYSSAHFEESGHIMTARLRSVKNLSVHESLRRESSYRSNQGAVWDGIAEQARMHDVSPATGAMKDIHDAKRHDLDAFLERFPVADAQNGLLVLVNGEVVGLDMISKRSAFKMLHPKLIRSYVMDALTERLAEIKDAPGEKAEAFLKMIIDCQEQRFESAGYGQDCRYEGKKIVGSALVHDQTVIHMAFFQVTQAEKAGRLSPVSRRRAFRTQQ